MTCDIHAAGSIELFFYGELPLEERGAVQGHLQRCPECRAVLDDLRIIRAALASRPDVSTPPGGDWSGFMSRLEHAIHQRPLEIDERGSSGGDVISMRSRRTLVSLLAMAALLGLVTISVLLVSRVREASVPDRMADAERITPASAPLPDSSSLDPALASLSGQHFERSKLVVLGLATKDAATADAANWTYERELASRLLDDTRLYRVAAEERGMKTLAGVMRDLELVLLQTSMTEQQDTDSLEQLQRLIRRRDLITKMNVSYTADR